jgi:hypothetical protein
MEVRSKTALFATRFILTRLFNRTRIAGPAGFLDSAKLLARSKAPQFQAVQGFE